MNEPTTDLRHTAIHEAGHAVAHARFGIQQHVVTIVPGENTLGHVRCEGAGHIYSNDNGEAGNMVIAFLAGYAALRAAGYDEAAAWRGTESDVAEAQELINFWELQRLELFAKDAVDIMSEPRNVKAVALVAQWLLDRTTISGELAGVLVEYSDGDCTEADFQRFLEHARLRNGSAG